MRELNDLWVTGCWLLIVWFFLNLFNERLGVDAAEITLLPRSFDASLDEIALAGFQFFLTGSFTLIPVAEIDLVAKGGQSKIGDCRNAGQIDEEFEGTENHRVAYRVCCISYYV